MKASVAQWIGSRTKQEDSYRIHFFPDGVLLLVCDGMGGYHHGDIAADRAASAFLHCFCESELPVTKRLESALESANREVARLVEESSQMGGTTLVAAYVGGGVVRWVSVGDSALFLWRRNRLMRVNADHSMKPLLQKVLSDCEPTSHLLRSALTGEPLSLVDISAVPIPLLPGDRLILSSDGADVVFNPAEISDEVRQILNSGSGREPADLVDCIRLLCGDSSDNVTILMLDI